MSGLVSEGEDTLSKTLPHSNDEGGLIEFPQTSLLIQSYAELTRE